MKGDFSRDTFDPSHHFLRVLMQQGRVQLDADWNEQVSVLLHYMRNLACDIIGPYGGPKNNCGFCIKPDKMDLKIGKGKYYVDGILCENDKDCHFSAQPNHPPVPIEDNKTYLVYLDVWERHINYIEDENIREVALGQADTATRSKIVWQVKLHDITNDISSQYCSYIHNNWEPGVKNKWQPGFKNKWQPENRGQLKAWAKVNQNAVNANPCTACAESQYSGPENQLYRVEIHKGGTAGTATFKWSRDNGSVIFPADEITTDRTAATIKLKNMGFDDRLCLVKGDWIEIPDDDYILANKSEPLGKVTGVNTANMQVTIEGITHVIDMQKNPYLRRWDHKKADKEGAIVLKEGEEILLEDGVYICFDNQNGNVVHTYRTGDYWLIPARTATRDILWPCDDKQEPLACSPHGLEHHYAPLAIIKVANNNITGVANNNIPDDCRRKFDQLGK